MLKSEPLSLEVQMPNALEVESIEISYSVDKWKELGPLNLLEMFKEHGVNFDNDFSHLEYGEF